MRIEDLAVYANVPSLLSDKVLLESFERDENVNKNPNNGLYTWKVRAYPAESILFAAYVSYSPACLPLSYTRTTSA